MIGWCLTDAKAMRSAFSQEQRREPSRPHPSTYGSIAPPRCYGLSKGDSITVQTAANPVTFCSCCEHGPASGNCLAIGATGLATAVATGDAGGPRCSRAGAVRRQTGPNGDHNRSSGDTYRMLRGLHQPGVHNGPSVFSHGPQPRELTRTPTVCGAISSSAVMQS